MRWRRRLMGCLGSINSKEKSVIKINRKGAEAGKARKDFAPLKLAGEGLCAFVVKLSVQFLRLPKYSYFIFLLLVAFPLQAQYNTTRLKAEIKKLQNDPVMKHGVWAVCVLTADSAKQLAGHQQELSLTPASTLKVLTTGAALGILGPDFRYRTTLEYTGSWDSIAGTINGDLYIRGSGDPSFGSKTMGDALHDSFPDPLVVWAKQLQVLGVRTITGKIIADASCFDENPVPPGWQWSDMGNYYGAGAYGLNDRDNRYRIYFDSGNPGDTVKIDRIDPVIPGMRLDNRVIASGSKDDAFIYGAPYAYYQLASGFIPPNRNDYDVDGAVPDPPLQAARRLQNELLKNGITVKNEPVSVRQKNDKNYQAKKQTRLLAEHASPQLRKIVHYVNLKSDNLYAECLLKTIAVQKGRPGQVDDGTEEVKKFWENKGLNTAGFYYNDGSGLSRSNAVSVQHLASALQLISKEKWFDDFFNSLPVAGVSGSLAGIGNGTAAEKNMHAKSGYITRARGYAGFVKDKKGRLLCFAILANNYTCTPTEMKKRLEKVMVAIAEIE